MDLITPKISCTSTYKESKSITDALLPLFIVTCITEFSLSKEPLSHISTPGTRAQETRGQPTTNGTNGVRSPDPAVILMQLMSRTTEGDGDRRYLQREEQSIAWPTSTVTSCGPVFLSGSSFEASSRPVILPPLSVCLYIASLRYNTSLRHIETSSLELEHH